MLIENGVEMEGDLDFNDGVMSGENQFEEDEYEFE